MTTKTRLPDELEFPAGIPGLPGATTFVLEAATPDGSDESLFEVLRAVDNSVELIVTQPWSFFPDYAPDLPDDELGELGSKGQRM